MIFYEIEVLSVPKIIFACSVEYEKYKNSFENKENFLEIALCEQGKILFEYSDGTNEITDSGMLIPMFRDISCNTSSYKNEKQKHTAVGVEMKYNLRRYNSETECDVLKLKERMKKSFIILIPYHCYMENKYDKTLSGLKRIIQNHSSQTPWEKVNAIGQWYLLTGMLTEFVLNKLNRVQFDFVFSELSYADKAVKYISSNYMKKLSVEEISDHLGISSGYLHRIFKNVKGMGVLEFINQHRIYAAISLMENRKLSLKEAALNVGIEDPSYMSRLFKNVVGMSCRKYFEAKK